MQQAGKISLSHAQFVAPPWDNEIFFLIIYDYLLSHEASIINIKQKNRQPIAAD